MHVPAAWRIAYSYRQDRSDREEPAQTQRVRWDSKQTGPTVCPGHGARRGVAPPPLHRGSAGASACAVRAGAGGRVVRSRRPPSESSSDPPPKKRGEEPSGRRFERLSPWPPSLAPGRARLDPGRPGAGPRTGAGRPCAGQQRRRRKNGRAAARGALQPGAGAAAAGGGVVRAAALCGGGRSAAGGGPWAGAGAGAAVLGEQGGAVGEHREEPGARGR